MAKLPAAKKESVRSRTVYLWKLWRAATSSADRQAATTEIFRINEGLIRTLARKYAQRSAVRVTDEDAYQVVAVALLDSLRTFDPSRGALATHLGWRVRHEMQQECERSMPIKISGFGPPYKVYRKIEAFYARHGRNPEAAEIGEDPKEFAVWMMQSEVHFRGERELERLDTGAATPEQDVEDGEQYEQANEALSMLTEEERNGVRRMFDEDDRRRAPKSTYPDALRKARAVYTMKQKGNRG